MPGPTKSVYIVYGKNNNNNNTNTVTQKNSQRGIKKKQNKG